MFTTKPYPDSYIVITTIPQRLVHGENYSWWPGSCEPCENFLEANKSWFTLHILLLVAAIQNICQFTINEYEKCKEFNEHIYSTIYIVIPQLLGSRVDYYIVFKSHRRNLKIHQPWNSFSESRNSTLGHGHKPWPLCTIPPCHLAVVAWDKNIMYFIKVLNNESKA